MKYTTVILLLVLKLFQHINADCDVDINDLPVKQPLYLIKAKNLLFPSTHDGHMKLKAREQIELFCPGSYDNPRGISNSQVFTCDTGILFSIGGTRYNISQIECSSKINPIVNKVTVAGMYEIGFNVNGRLIRQMDIFFDDHLKMARYVRYTLLPGSYSTKNNGVDMEFTGTRDVYGLTTAALRKIYSKKSEQAMITNVFGNMDYINNNTKFLARGHLASRADFVYMNEQRATYLYMNVAPQWQTFNVGNWKTIEGNVKKYMQTKALHKLEIYTGVHDVLALPNVNGVLTKMYLDYNAKIFPVPKFYYKVVINPITNQGVALIGVNNPYLTMAEINRDYIICTDIKNQLNWLTFNNADLNSGYLYACEVSDFTHRNPTLALPTLHVTSLLK